MSGWWSGWRSRRHKRAVQEGESVCPTRAYVLAVHVTHCHNMSEWQRAVRQGPLPNCSVTSASAFSQLSLPIRQTEMRVVQLLSPLVFVLLHPLTMPVLTFCMGLNPIPVSLKCFQCGCRAKALVSVLDIWCYTIYVVTGTLAPPQVVQKDWIQRGAFVTKTGFQSIGLKEGKLCKILKWYPNCSHHRFMHVSPPPKS